MRDLRARNRYGGGLVTARRSGGSGLSLNLLSSLSSGISGGFLGSNLTFIRPATSNVGGCSQEDSSWGRAYRSGASGRYLNTGTLGYALSSSWSVVAAVTCDASPNGGIVSAEESANRTTQDRGLGIKTGKWDLYRFGASVPHLQSSSSATAGAHVVVAVVSSTSGSSLYVDGNLEASDSSTGVGYSGYASPIRTWLGGQEYAFFAGSVALGLDYGRALTTDEVAEVSADPFCMFIGV